MYKFELTKLRKRKGKELNINVVKLKRLLIFANDYKVSIPTYNIKSDEKNISTLKA